MKNKSFHLLLAIITVIALFLRFVDYSIVPPIDEAFDEVHYAWGGATWIENGVPKSWSNFDSYKNVENIERYGIRWRLVSPVIEKPPLYFLLSGLTVLLSRPGDIFDVSHKIIRLLPLVLSVFSVILTGILARKIFNKQVAILATILYGITPTIILANRMSITENLLTPLALAAIILISQAKIGGIQKVFYVSLISYLSILTKQIGVAVSFSFILLLYLKNEFKALKIVIISSFLAFATYAAIGVFYDWQLFLSLQQNVRIGHTLSGLPEIIADIFRFPTIGPKNHPFLDGTILLGYILLFSAPLWLGLKDFKTKVFLVFPYTYLILLSIGESGATPFSFFGWYLYPLLPFLIILVARLFHDLWQKPTIFLAAFIGLTIGSSLVRFIFLLMPRQFHYLWQYSYIIVILLLLTAPFLAKKVSKAILVALFTVFIICNVLVDLNLPSIYDKVALNDQSLKGFEH